MVSHATALRTAVPVAEPVPTTAAAASGGWARTVQPWLPLLWGLAHALVDAASVMVVFATLGLHRLPPFEAFHLVLSYDLLAFSLQTPFGALQDRWQAGRPVAQLGFALVAAGTLLLPSAAWPAMVLVGLGNACFHVGAGALVLRVAPLRAAPAGVFVAPGALGLAFGTWLGKSGDGVGWPFAVGLLLCLLGSFALPAPRYRYDLTTDPLFGAEVGRARRNLGCPVAVVALLLLSAFVRAFIGFAGGYRCPKTTLVLFAFATAAFTGKALGGYFADRVGWLRSSVGALALSAPLVAFGGEHWPIVVAGMLLFQMTMPVTLVAVAMVFPRRPGLAFGLPCLALVLGSVPTFYPWLRPYYGPGVFAALIACSALALWGGLRLLGPLGDPPRRVAVRGG
jgi:FSR family fosmidomycin resistance protein-like MFS transporter